MQRKSQSGVFGRLILLWEQSCVEAMVGGFVLKLVLFSMSNRAFLSFGYAHSFILSSRSIGSQPHLAAVGSDAESGHGGSWYLLGCFKSQHHHWY